MHFACPAAQAMMYVCERIWMQKHRYVGVGEMAKPILPRALAEAHSLTMHLIPASLVPPTHSGEPGSMRHRCQVVLLSNGTLSCKETEGDFFPLKIMQALWDMLDGECGIKGLDLIYPYPKDQCGQELHKCRHPQGPQVPTGTNKERSVLNAASASRWLNCQHEGAATAL